MGNVVSWNHFVFLLTFSCFQSTFMVVFAGYGNSQRCIAPDLRVRATVTARTETRFPQEEDTTLWRIENKDLLESLAAAPSPPLSPVKQEPDTKDPPTLLDKFMAMFGSDDEEVEEPKLEPKKQAFFDNLFASQNMDLSSSSSDIFAANNEKK